MEIVSRLPVRTGGAGLRPAEREREIEGDEWLSDAEEYGEASERAETDVEGVRLLLPE